LIINRVELEDYIYSVLFTESWPGWPLEVNKAFAIASRSYVIAKFLENKEKTKKHYHVKNTNKHQTYQGTHKSTNLRNAVDETIGIVLGYNKKPILAMFDACCGGIVPANIKGVNFKHAPYLERKEKCIFCEPCKLYSWQVEYSVEEFEQLLKKHLPNLKNIQTINLIKDKAGTVQRINIKDKKGKLHNLTGKKFYSLFDKVKSFSFSIIKNAKKVLIKGSGYGHHLGICQWGAKEMVNRGWDFKNILNFYYPGTSFMKLKN
jgi:stage II sporulation protein D